MPSVEFSLLVATTNQAKGRELQVLLAPSRFGVLTLADVTNPIEVVEDGDTFAANARKKAIEHAQHQKTWVLADDSGLEVDALGGAPGVYSARYAGEAATDEKNNKKLLAELGNTPLEKRTAAYYCHIAVADPTGKIRAESCDRCGGRIRFEPVGTNGFGYDPLFEIVELHRTFGELGPLVKSTLSHRGRAIRRIVPQLIHLANSGQWH
jgi:XTP/dITP diphosphohydrolase